MIMLIDLPLPVHGMSNVNAAMLNKVTEAGVKPVVINTAPSYLARYFNTRLWSLLKISHTLYCYLYMLTFSLRNIGGVVYRPINGGAGQLYDLIYIALCRIFQNKIYIHHHSFNYLNNKSRLFLLLNWVAGKDACHVVLGARMGDLLSQTYGVEYHRVKIISNLSFFESTTALKHKPKGGELILGHLANLCLEKGLGVFIDICRELQELGVNYKAIIAGPFADDVARNTVINAIRELSRVQYIGPVYADKKKNFYESIDCFVFPSMYKNEAEPLVLYEAALNGVYITGTNRGCMKDVIAALGGFSVDESEDIARAIAADINIKLNEGSFSHDVKNKRLTCYEIEQASAKFSLQGLISGMKNDDLSRFK